MAERRMFAKSVIGSARFLKMPATSRLLYYDLGMEADDDGCVEAFGIIRKTGASEDDLRVLVSRGFVRILNEDLVTYILDWNANNQIRKDRYHEGIYKNLIDTSCRVALSGVSQSTTNCQPSDNQLVDSMETEVSLGKSSIGKDSLVEGKEADKPPTRPRFTPPTVEQVKAYCTEKGYTVDADRFVDYYTSNGWRVGKNPMKDWKAAVRTWNRKEQPNGKAESKHVWTVGTVV
ncbi:MAG: hypothetical protein IKJ99_04800 [Oscillospiraceae bacterium]|nr:hypothetical protein [Oscillospiraceae bacterium]